jgi:hypothetical protein
MKLSEASPGTQATFDWEEAHIPVVRRLGWREGRQADVWIRAVLETMSRPYTVKWAEAWASKERIAKRRANLGTRGRNRAAQYQEKYREAARERKRREEQERQSLIDYNRERAEAIADYEKRQAEYECKGVSADALVEYLKQRLRIQNPREWDQFANRGDIGGMERHILEKTYERIMAEEQDDSP